MDKNEHTKESMVIVAGAAMTMADALKAFKDELHKANELLRSCYTTAERRGAFTNWTALKEQLENRLEYQQKLLSNGENNH